MKKYVSIVILGALLLTGCGKTAGTAESSTSAGDASSVTDASSEQADLVAQGDSAENEAGQDTVFTNWHGIDMPVPPEMQRDERNMLCWAFHNIPLNTTIDNPVYYVMNSIHPEPGEDGEYPTYTPEELPELLEITLHRSINNYYSSDEVYSKKTVESKLEGKILGEPAIGEKGTIITPDDTKLNYVAYYTFVDMPGLYLETKVPAVWIAFTPSDDQDALELMNRAAEAPLKEAKFHEN